MTEPFTPERPTVHLSDEVDDLVPSHGYKRIPLVGLGGSAGSIEALQVFFTKMPADCGLAFAVVIHLSAEHESALTELLQRCTRMPVVKVEGVLKVARGTVYVIPPGKLLRCDDGELGLADFPLGRTGQMAVDIFLRTLADSHGPHAAAVVLSGLDGDGAIGIKRIKERGGLTVAQDPEEAMHSGMPRSAIQTGMVDWVLPVADMPGRILSYFNFENAIVLPPEEAPAAAPGKGGVADETGLQEVLDFLRTRTGRDFTNYKRGTIVRRIARRMQVNGVDHLGGYLNCLRTRPGEASALLQDLLISVTNFFRDAECFEALERHVIPRLFEGKGPSDVLRVWVVACATGEEAYSIAMLLADHARTLDAPPSIQVFATDLDEEAVRIAREGIYPTPIVADVSDERLRRFFSREHRGFRVRRELREMVLFATHDVLKDSPFSRLDLVTCRNLLIYLTREAQGRVLDTLHFALLPHGKMMLGSSEAVDDTSTLFTVMDKKHRIYMQRPVVVRRALPVQTSQPNLKLTLEAQFPARDAPVVTAGTAFDRMSVAPARTGETTRGPAWSDVHLQVLEQLAPPSILINADYEILHLSPNAGRFLQLAGGEPSRNLMHAVAPSVRLELRGALYQAGQSKEQVVLPPLPLEFSGGVASTAVRVIPLEDCGETMFVVSFDALGDEQHVAEDAGQRLQADPLARHLDREIERLKQNLRETVEQYEASTEELKASNEELQAMNEELRAATEELETSREELQSINEELTTVNQELKGKVDQLSHANSDMHNLMDATAIATVFLDRELRITRYTPSAVSLFNLIPSDVGRPLTDMATQLDYVELGDDARRVLERLVPVEREVGQSNGSWYLARLMPYRTLEDRIAGVVFTFIDITERKRAEEMRLWLAAVVSSTSDAIISFALDGTILSWNAGAERIFGYTADDAIGKPVELLGVAEDGERQQLLAEIRAGRPVEQPDVLRRRKDGSDVHLAINASPIRDASGKVLAGTAVLRDITAAHEAAEALRQSNERLRLVVENVREYAIFATDLERRITSWNAGAQRILGYTSQEALGRSADMIFVAEDRVAGAPEKESSVALAEGRAADERDHLRKDGSRFHGSGVMMLMRNSSGEAVGFVKVLRDPSERLPEPFV